MKRRTATCERTGQEVPLNDGFFAANRSTGEWSFVCIDAPELSDEYNIRVAHIVKSPEALIDWIAHLNEKTWFDAKKFCDFMTRCRRSNELYGVL